jgi:protein O-GlcNAc transferase
MPHPLLAQYVNAAHAANQQGQSAKAVEYSQLALALNPSMPEAWFNLGIAQARLGQKTAATATLEQARRHCMDSVEGQNSIGLHLLELGALEAAELCLQQAIKLAPHYAYAHSNLGKLYRTRKLPDIALQHVRIAIELAPHEPLLQVNLAGVFLDLKQYAQAEVASRKAIELAPTLAQSWVNLSAALQRQNQLAAAESAACKALELSARSPEAWEALGLSLVSQHRFKDAETAFKKSVELNPLSSEAWAGLGAMYSLQLRHPQAETAYRKSLVLDQRNTGAWCQLGLTLKELKRIDEGLNCLRRAYEQEPGRDYLLCWKLMTQAAICEWDNWESDLEKLTAGIKDKTTLADPLSFTAFVDDPQTQKTAAEKYAQHEHPAHPGYQAHCPRSAPPIRIGYFSADFRDHPVAQLLVELLEFHDRSRFETVGFSLSPEASSPLGQRIAKAFDHFIDASNKSDIELIELAREQTLDIAINLAGYTAGNRNTIFAHRIAPIQVNYLGYAGTMGAEYMDYLITDFVVCPPGSEVWYTEKLARLPHCFMPHDGQQAISDHTPLRSEFGLPEQGFVFCCFNNHHKISPEVFHLWMRLLQQIDGSILWLSDGPELLKANLRREAIAHGVAPERVIFAPRVDAMADHLARYRLADLFVDTLPYNAHTTACDALWAGVPVLTRMGQCFASRVASSLLHAAGLPELVTTSSEAYEALALSLARNPDQLRTLRQTLAERRSVCQLFNTRQLTRDFESLLLAMHQRHLDGLEAEHLSIN